MSAQRLVSGLILLLLSACQSTETTLSMNQASTLINGSVRLGMGRADVINRLGTPQQIETNGSMEFLFYRAPWMMNWATSSSNPIAVMDGKVVGMGSVFYSEHRAEH